MARQRPGTLPEDVSVPVGMRGPSTEPIRLISIVGFTHIQIAQNPSKPVEWEACSRRNPPRLESNPKHAFATSLGPESNEQCLVYPTNQLDAGVDHPSSWFLGRFELHVTSGFSPQRAPDSGVRYGMGNSYTPKEGQSEEHRQLAEIQKNICNSSNCEVDVDKKRHKPTKEEEEGCMEEKRYANTRAQMTGADRMSEPKADEPEDITCEQASLWGEGGRGWHGNLKESWVEIWVKKPIIMSPESGVKVL
ncbi:hypothetical protein K438DRAFT_1746872 [Mycena galopus ATCC 62051]|nr:hypothetical protein K438DRAFT_1746872 [Mycena galopus ATCC 62051]